VVAAREALAAAGQELELLERLILVVAAVVAEWRLALSALLAALAS
jgi:hypothetical protein